MAAGCSRTTPTTAPATISVSSTKVNSTPTAGNSPTTRQPQTPTPTIALNSPTNADEVIQKAIQAVSKLNTYRLERSVHADKTGFNKSGESVTTSSTCSSSMYLQIPQKLMQMNNKVITKQTVSQPAWPLFVSNYYIEDNATGYRMYIQGLFPEDPEVWSQTPITEAAWLAQNQAVQLLQVIELSKSFKLTSEYYQTGEALIPCTVLEGAPSLSEFWVLMANQPGVKIPSAAPAGTTLDQFVKTANLKLWLDQTRDLPLKAELTLDFTLNHELLPSLSSDTRLVVEISQLFFDYDKALDIQVPIEAFSSTELDLQPYTKSTAASPVTSTTPPVAITTPKP
jgi:hypothetical protein